MNKQDKYRASSLANFTPEELAKARANAAIAARRDPEGHAKTMAIIEEKGLGNHREILSHFLRYPSPITEHELATIMLYQDTSYAGPYGRGEQHEAKPNINTDIADLLYRPAIKPDGV